MALRHLIHIGNPILKAKNIEITDFTSSSTKKLIKDLKDTMLKAGLIGIAAPQIGENYRVFVTYPKKTKFRNLGKVDEFRVFINPEVISLSEEKCIIYEGCGCVPGIQEFGPVVRPKEVTIEAYDEKGIKFRLSADGILARVIQHEWDHLIGHEFLDRMKDLKQLVTREYYVKHIRNAKKFKKALKVTKIEFKKVKGDITIKKEKLEDDRVVKVIFEIVRSSFIRDFDPRTKNTGIVKKYLENCEVYVAYDHDKPIGYFGYEKKPQNIIDLKSIAVIPEYQGKGIGTQLLLNVIKLTKGKIIRLVVHPRNTQALLCYLKNGFTVTGWTENFFGDGHPRLKLER